MHGGRLLLTITLAAGWLHVAAALAADTSPAGTRPAADEVLLAESDHPPLAVRRIVKGFDFDERKFDNYTALPLSWQQHIAAGFPQFLEGRFDADVGHLAPPSFRLDLDGGSIGFAYVGRDIAVRPGGDYLLVAWVRSEGLRSARAYVTACFLDRKGNPIPGTEQRSRLAGGHGRLSSWEPLSIQMRCDRDEACYLALSLWVAQDRIWNTGPRRVRSIDREDIQATAWFDDVVVYRMPRVSLAAARPGGLFAQRDPIELLVELSDPDGLNLRGRLTVENAEGRSVFTGHVPVQTDSPADPKRILLPDLPVGWYRADFHVTSEAGTLLKRSVCFLRLPERVGVSTEANRGFGLVLGDIDPQVAAGQRQLLGELGPQYVKLPVWYAQQALLHQLAGGQALDTSLQVIREVQADPVGILRDDPAYVPDDPANKLMSMADLFKEPPSSWKHLIAPVWMRYAGLIQVWQMGADDEPAPLPDDDTFGLIPRIRQEMVGLMAEPALAATRSIRLPISPDDPADYRSVLLPTSINPDDISAHLQAQVGSDARRLWVTVDPLPAPRYPRELRLADLARRLVETCEQSPGAVFLDAPWDVRTGPAGRWIDPREDYLVIRTVAGLIGGARPLPRTTLDGTAECAVFDHRGSAVLCVWDEHAPPAGHEHRLEFGGHIQQVDLWGRPTFPRPTGRVQTVRIGPTPTFLINCPTWLIEFRRQFTVRPAVVEASFEKLQVEIALQNTHPEPITGLVRLVLPPEWDVRPNQLSFALPPGGQFRQTVDLTFPPNAQTRIMPLLGEFAIDAERRYEFTAPAWFDFGIQGLDLTACAFRARKQVTVRLSMTNRTAQPLHFEAYLVAPDRQRLERQFSDFQPGTSLTRSFVLPDADDLAGQNVRLSLREIQGNRFFNRLVAIP